MQNIRSLGEAEVAGKRVLLRVDFNVPLDTSSGHVVVTDDSRIRAVLPTITLLRDRGAAKIILATHLGRPESGDTQTLRTAPLLAHLKTLVTVTNIEMLENLRFNAGEEVNDPSFAQELASHADVFVNDAFAASHRTHASIIGVATLLPSYAGLLVEREVAKLSEALTPPQSAIAIVGGAKVETKAPLIEKLAKTYAKVFVGGNIANKYTPQDKNVFLPQDGVPQLQGMLDVGPETTAAWVQDIKAAPFVLWAGPVGWFEKGYGEATDALARALVESGVQAVIGGGDTAAAIKKFNFDPEKVFISTGGGAMLEFLVHGTLPGLEVLKG